MYSSLTESELLDALASGTLVVLPNARAARALRHAYDQRQRAANSAAWDSPAVLSWTDWTRSLWTGLVTGGHELRLLLNAAQEHSLWREIVASSTSNESLSSPDALAELAARSFALAAAHCIPLARLRSAAITHDSRSFALWAADFTRLCQKNNYLSAALLEDALREHAAQDHLALTQSILLAGFGELTPAQTALLDALRSTGAAISQHAPANTPRAEDTLRASVLTQTPRDEQLLAARWIRRFVAERAANQQPTRVAVIPLGADDAGDDAAALECIFREQLAPELQCIDADLSSTPWEFAAAPSLATHPLATAALDLLRLASGALSLDRISGLLRSPFLGAISERDANARFDAFGLRRDRPLQPQLTLAELLARRIRYLQHPAPSPRPAPTCWLPAFAEAARKLTSPATRSFADWAELIRTLLRAANFPGDRALTAASAADVELLRAWDSTLDLLATLDFRGQRVPFAEAVTTLERLAHTTPCSTPHTHAPVQVMGLAEAEGSLFDAVVLLHATDQAWPAPQRTDPLLSWPLQRELGLPGADKPRDAARAHREAADLLARSGAVLITFAREDADGKLRPSSLLDALPIPRCESADLDLPETVVEPIAEECIEDTAPLPPLPSSVVHGGAHLLQLQAACGFRAFAELRLRARELEEAPLGLDALESGNLIHRTLELFWKEVKSQGALRVMPTVERERILSRCISAALAQLIAPADHWSTAYLTLQRTRLHSLLEHWIELELTRQPFTVLPPETKQTIPIGPLDLTVRLDRIDQLDDGSLIFVDYKTGASATTAGWDGDRPDEPQLPLYSLLAEPGQLKGLLFGKVRPGKDARWLGVASEDGILPSSRNKLIDLDAQIAEWREVLTGLAEDFASGHATVDPKNYPVTCKHCGQRLLCRLNPDDLQVQDEEDEETNSIHGEDVHG